MTGVVSKCRITRELQLVHREQPRLPVVAMEKIRQKDAAPHFERPSRQGGKPLGIVRIIPGCVPIQPRAVV